MPVALVLGSSYIVRLCTSDRRGRVFAEAAGCAMLIFALLSPWMLSLRRASGTLLYPLLGHGVDGKQYGITLGTEAFASIGAKLSRYSAKPGK